ncbi:hypothetical protein MT418_004469 [Batrachochytrium dendrobatidis]
MKLILLSVSIILFGHVMAVNVPDSSDAEPSTSYEVQISADLTRLENEITDGGEANDEEAVDGDEITDEEAAELFPPGYTPLPNPESEKMRVKWHKDMRRYSKITAQALHLKDLSGDMPTPKADHLLKLVKEKSLEGFLARLEAEIAKRPKTKPSCSETPV